jgi:deoxycytidine triphosphate deaminase
MSLITHDELVSLVQASVIEGVAPDHINAASIDVTLGNILWVEASPNGLNTVVDLIDKETPAMTQIDLGRVGYYDLAPGQFCLAQTREMFNLPEGVNASHWQAPAVAGEYKLKSSMARAGMGHLLAGWCLVGSTKIPLADGTEAEIRDLVGRDDVYVYAAGSNGKLFYVKKAENIHCTKWVQHTVKVYLNNGHSFECTPDHEFLLSSGKDYAAAAAFSNNTSLCGHLLTDELCLSQWDMPPPEVVCAKPLYYTKPVPVYDMTVPELHNFAISAGVFAHNCDPGWTGSVLTLEFVNHLKYHSLKLRPGMRCGQIVLWRGEAVPAHASYAVRGRYNNDAAATPSKGVG